MRTVRISKAQTIFDKVIPTKWSNGLPPKYLHDNGVDVRKLLAVGKVRQSVSAYHLVDLRLCFSLHQGMVQHCANEYGDNALGLSRKVEIKGVAIEPTNGLTVSAPA